MRILSLLLCVLTITFLQAQDIKIYPTPQSVKTNARTIVLDAPVFLNGAAEADTTAVEQLRLLLKSGAQKKSYTIYIGERNDRAVKKYDKFIPQVAGGYYLSITPAKTVIAGNDERGTFYAVQTLKQLVKNDTLPEIEITDYPTVAFRGVVEGFYGQPWSHKDRISQLRFYGENKLNTYIYGPKDDPYHSSPHWRKAYPEKEARQISELVALSKASKVDFVWAVHPGQDIQWNDDDRQALLDKFENMYKLGVRSFAVFFDDISGEGTDPVRQAELLNFLHDRFVAKKTDVTPLIMCPTEYNKSWSNPKPGTYLDILGDKLYPSIMIMWTGDRVISDITAEGLEWINKRIKRPAYIWWNFPVNDYVRDHLLMGPSYGLDLTVGQQMSGFVSNPMERAEASKIAIFSVADYAWNPAKYDSNAAWEKAIQVVMPHAADAFRTFAAHNSDLGKNGHRYRRDESVEIKPTIEKFTADYRKDILSDQLLKEIANEYQKIAVAGTSIRAFNDNPELIREITPWLEQFTVLGKAGLAVTRLVTLKTPHEIWKAYCEFLNLEAQRQAIDKKENKNPYQPGVKTGSLVMQPFIDTIASLIADRFYIQSGGNTLTSTATAEPQLYTDITQLKNQTLQQTSNTVAINPVLEVIKIGAGQYAGIELPQTPAALQLEAELNTAIGNWGKFQISTDGKTWEDRTPNSRTNTVITLNDKPVRFVRFCNTGKKDREIYLKKFILTLTASDDRLKELAFLQDGKLNTACPLSQRESITVVNPCSGQNTTVTILQNTSDPVSLKVTGFNSKGNPTELGIITEAYARLDCPAGITTLRLTSEKGATNLNEIIWRQN